APCKKCPICLATLDGLTTHRVYKIVYYPQSIGGIARSGSLILPRHRSTLKWQLSLGSKLLDGPNHHFLVTALLQLLQLQQEKSRFPLIQQLHHRINLSLISYLIVIYQLKIRQRYNKVYVYLHFVALRLFFLEQGLIKFCRFPRVTTRLAVD